MPVMSAEDLNKFLADVLPDVSTPFVVVEEAADWGVRLRVPVTQRDARPGGTISGPTMMMAADTAAWLAILAQIGPVALAVTTSLHIDFLRKPALGDLMVEGRLLKLGRRLGVVHSVLRPADGGDPVASAQVTYSIPPR